MTQKNFVHDFENLVPSKNDTPYKRILAIGDIHGEFTKLMSLWEKIKVTDDDLIIFLGDYIDRGSEVDKVLNWAMDLNQKKKYNFSSRKSRTDDAKCRRIYFIKSFLAEKWRK